MNIPSRRDFFKFATITAATAAIPATAQASVDPHPEWLEQWRKARADWLVEANNDEGGHGETPECREAVEREYLLRDRISKTVACTQVGINAQLEFLCEDMKDDLRGQFGEDFLASICGKRITA